MQDTAFQYSCFCFFWYHTTDQIYIFGIAHNGYRILSTLSYISTTLSGFRTPFNIVVHTDSTEGSAATAETLNRGFCLDFVQQPCSTTSG